MLGLRRLGSLGYTARMRAGRPGASTIAAEVIFRSHADIHPRSKVHAAVKHDLHIIGCVWQRQRPMQFHSLPTLVRRQKFHLLPLLKILHSNAHLEQRRDALPVRSHLMLFYKAVRATTKMISWHVDEGQKGGSLNFKPLNRAPQTLTFNPLHPKHLNP